MLEKIRAKPDHIKQTIAICLTIFLFSIVLFVWWSSWDARKTGDETREKAVSPLTGITSVLKGITGDIKSSYSSMDSFENATTTATTSMSRTAFDMASVVILDSSVSATTTIATTTATTTQN